MSVITHEQTLIRDVLRGRDVKILSQILRVSQKTIYRWINGDCKPSLSSYKKMMGLNVNKKK